MIRHLPEVGVEVGIDEVAVRCGGKGGPAPVDDDGGGLGGIGEQGGGDDLEGGAEHQEEVAALHQLLRLLEAADQLAEKDDAGLEDVAAAGQVATGGEGPAAMARSHQA